MKIHVSPLKCVIGDAPDGRMHLYKRIGGEDAR